MSRIGTTPITISADIALTIDPNSITIKGPKGQLTQSLHRLIKLEQPEERILVVKRKSDIKMAKSLHGTYHRLIKNMVTGVTVGFQKSLELVGTGYRVAKQGEKLVLSLGFSHPVEYKLPSGIEAKIEGNNKITIEGIDKQLVGEVAATIRSFRPPEPYKGKGIRYENEIVRRKAGKAAKTAA